MKTEFQSGPFLFVPGRAAILNGHASQRCTLAYGAQTLNERWIPDPSTQDEIRELFTDDVADFAAAARTNYAPEIVHLVDFESGESVASFPTTGVHDMTPGLIDDRSKYWLRTADRMRSRDVTLSGFAALAAKYRAPENAWIASLLPDDVLIDDSESWRAPTNWEIRHIVGEGSFTGVSGARAAALVGVTPSNFRKYTASDSAKNRQSISFAMWHLLLHRLGVQSIEIAE